MSILSFNKIVAIHRIMVIELSHVIQKMVRSLILRVMLYFDEIFLIHKIAMFKLCYIF